ncbi:MAG: hypothetical protein PHR46_03630, partial [Candidatus Absconditabacteria bacterium]|nr:hypothetical protein [Candidatus Absconditabacteria bacterium]
MNILQNIKSGFVIGLSGLVVIIGGLSVYAAINNNRTNTANLEAIPGAVLTAENWNKLVGNVEYLNGQVEMLSGRIEYVIGQIQDIIEQTEIVNCEDPLVLLACALDSADCPCTDYIGSGATLTAKGQSSSHYYSAGKVYEVARLQVKANAAEIAVNGFTLTNSGSFDVKSYLSEVTVTKNGITLNDVSFSTVGDEIRINFPKDIIEARKSTTYIVSFGFEGLDEFGKTIELSIKDATAFRAVETNTNTRVSINPPKVNFNIYTINGNKITLITITDRNAVRNTVIKSDTNVVLASFVLKAEENSSIADLTSFDFTGSALLQNSNYIRVRIDGTTEDAVWDSANSKYLVEGINYDLTDGVEVEISHTAELGTGDYSLTLGKVNGVNKNREYKRKVVGALVYIYNQVSDDDETKFTFSVDKKTSSDIVSDLSVYVSGAVVGTISGEFSNNDFVEVANDPDAVKYIDKIVYSV